MAKLHMRLSVELDITDDQLKELVINGYREIIVDALPRPIRAMIEAGRFRPCDWDDGGYVPEEWLEWDAEEAGIENEEDAEV